ncbi:MAG: RNA polymerase factor sigma-32 [Candidatus Binataceae bacterium]
MARKASKPRKRRSAVAEPIIIGDEPELSENPSEDLLREGDAVDDDAADPATIEVSDFHPLEPDPDSDLPDPDRDREAAHIESKDPDGGALVAIDPLSRYLADLRRFPLLSREEETVIAKRYARDHDPADAYQLVTANLRLVVKIAFEFARASKNVLDLIQEGNVGLMEAVKNFDPYRGIRFPSYAVWWVRAYIYRYLINNWRLVKIGTTQAQRKLFFNLRKETERLEAQGFAAQPKQLAQVMGVKESEVREMQERMAQNEVSLDQPTAAGEDTRLIDVLPDRENNPEEAAAAGEWREFAHERVAEFAATLRDKELEIFRARLLTENPDTLQEIGARFGISRERVRQIETRLKQRLKEFIQSKSSDIGDSDPN